MVFLRSFLVATVLAFASFGAAPVLASDAYHARLDTLARQSMRAYRMTKSVCLVMMGTQTDVHAEMALKTSYEFEEQMTALLDGSESAGFGAETDPDLRRALEATRAYSLPMTISARQVASGDFHGVPVTLLLRRHQTVSAQIQTIWRQAAQTYSGQATQSDYLKTIEAVHLMNALTQEVLRDLCFVRLGLMREETQLALSGKIIVFETMIRQLKEGDPEAGFIKAPNIYAKIGYDKVASRWRTLKPILESAIAGEDVEIGDIQLASVMGESLMKQMNDILGRYEPPQ